MPKLEIGEYKKVQVKWLETEIKTHSRDLILAEGKLNELKELKERLVQMCDYCGDKLYGIYSHNTDEENLVVIKKHMEQRHESDLEAWKEEIGVEEAVAHDYKNVHIVS